MRNFTFLGSEREWLGVTLIPGRVGVSIQALTTSPEGHGRAATISTREGASRKEEVSCTVKFRTPFLYFLPPSFLFLLPLHSFIALPFVSFSCLLSVLSPCFIPIDVFSTLSAGYSTIRLLDRVASVVIPRCNAYESVSIGGAGSKTR